MNGLYSEAADKYREVNGDIIDAQKATANLNSAMAELGAIAEPIITKLKQLAAELLQDQGISARVVDMYGYVRDREANGNVADLP